MSKSCLRNDRLRYIFLGVAGISCHAVAYALALRLDRGLARWLLTCRHLVVRCPAPPSRTRLRPAARTASGALVCCPWEIWVARITSRTMSAARQAPPIEAAADSACAGLGSGK